MHLRSSIRFKGYWLSLLAWALVSFGSAAASAIDTSEAYWFRLCSVNNVSWQQMGTVDNSPQASSCACLSHTVVSNNNPADRPLFKPHRDSAVYALGEQTLASRHLPQPRAPPVIL